MRITQCCNVGKGCPHHASKGPYTITITIQNKYEPNYYLSRLYGSVVFMGAHMTVDR